MMATKVETGALLWNACCPVSIWYRTQPGRDDSFEVDNPGLDVGLPQPGVAEVELARRGFAAATVLREHLGVVLLEAPGDTGAHRPLAVAAVGQKAGGVPWRCVCLPAIRLLVKSFHQLGFVLRPWRCRAGGTEGFALRPWTFLLEEIGE
jgi:hypothetical protein